MNKRFTRAAAWFSMAVVLGGLATWEYFKAEERTIAHATSSIPSAVSAPSQRIVATVLPAPDPDNPRNWSGSVSLESLEGEWYLSQGSIDGGAEGSSVFVTPVVSKNRNLRKRWSFLIASKLDAGPSETTMKCSLIDDGRTGYYPGTCGSSTVTFHIRQNLDKIFIENYDLVLKRVRVIHE